MFYIPPIAELSMIGVAEAGVPNRERICLRPTDSINLAQFGIFAGVRNEKGVITPISNLFFWFGDFVVSPPSWLIVLTGKGERPAAPIVEDGKVMHLFYWNQDSTIFNIPNIVPVAFKMNNVLIGHNLFPPGPRQISNPVS